MPLQHLEMFICAHTDTLEKSPHKEYLGLCHLEATRGILHLNIQATFLLVWRTKLKSCVQMERNFPFWLFGRLFFGFYSFPAGQSTRLNHSYLSCLNCKLHQETSLWLPTRSCLRSSTDSSSAGCPKCQFIMKSQTWGQDGGCLVPVL